MVRHVSFHGPKWRLVSISTWIYSVFSQDAIVANSRKSLVWDSLLNMYIMSLKLGYHPYKYRCGKSPKRVEKHNFMTILFLLSLPAGHPAV